MESHGVSVIVVRTWRQASGVVYRCWLSGRRYSDIEARPLRASQVGRVLDELDIAACALGGKLIRSTQDGLGPRAVLSFPRRGGGGGGGDGGEPSGDREPRHPSDDPLVEVRRARVDQVASTGPGPDVV